MTGFEIIAILLSVTALFSYLNFRFLKLPTTIGVMLIAMLVSAALVTSGHIGWGGNLPEKARTLLEQIKWRYCSLLG